MARGREGERGRDRRGIKEGKEREKEGREGGEGTGIGQVCPLASVPRSAIV